MSIASRLSRFAGRPLLMAPEPAMDMALRVRALDAEIFTRADLWTARPGALLRRLEPAKAKKAAKAKPKAMEDDDGESVTVGPVCYAPLYASEPEDYGFGWTLVDGLACIEVEGPLLDRGSSFCGWQHGYDTLALTLREAMADPRVKGVFLKMDTPGGVVHGGLDAFATQLRQARASGNVGGKPIHVFADMAASAGYWIAAQADTIAAPAAGILGSIGVVYVHEDYSAALERAGVRVTPVQFGAKKTDGAGWKALSEEARADIQAEVDEIGARFIAAVTAGRPALTADALIATQAACFMARHSDPARSALALGLADAIMTEEQAFLALKAAAFPPITTVSPPASASAPAQPARNDAKPAARKQKDASMTTRKITASSPKELTPEEKAARRDEIAEILSEDAPDDANKAVQFDRVADVVNRGGEEAPAEEAAPAPAEGGEAAAIAASAEAKTHPQLALAAIGAKMTLAQFQASAMAAAPEGRQSFADKMAGAPRVGLDGKAGGGKADNVMPMGSIAERRAKASGRA